MNKLFYNHNPEAFHKFTRAEISHFPAKIFPAKFYQERER